MEVVENIVSFKKSIYFYLMHKCMCLHICMLTTKVPGTHGGQKRLSDSLELGLQIAVSHNVHAETQTWVLCKSSEYYYPLSYLSSPREHFFLKNTCLEE